MLSSSTYVAGGRRFADVAERAFWVNALVLVGAAVGEM